MLSINVQLFSFSTKSILFKIVLWNNLKGYMGSNIYIQIYIFLNSKLLINSDLQQYSCHCHQLLNFSFNYD